MDVSELTKSLSSYNETVNGTAEAIAASLRPLAVIILGICYLIEIDSWWRTFKQEGGNLTSEMWFEVAYKYLISLLLISMSSQIFDAMVAVVNIALNLIDAVVPGNIEEYNLDLGTIKGWFLKNVVNFIGGLVQGTASLSTKLLTMMRFFQMYLLKAFAPLLVAFFLPDSTRSIALNILKHFGAAAFQAIILFVVLRLYPTLVTSDILSINTSGTLANWGTAFVSIAKGIIFIFMLFGSQKLAKSLIGAM
ncbi:hypothetical protein ACS60J_09895 [Streptococcus suis]|uniref:hypothetical protein n=1 Tax=Streptococcus TaxID=1301 RepID=UPI000CF4B382|nr:hypothetical protein [Streptococcus suis]HEM6511307.1 hypothetical protein [Streptococcus suis]